MKELDAWNFLEYNPAINASIQSYVRMAVFTEEFVEKLKTNTSADADMHYYVPIACPKSGQAEDTTCSKSIQVTEQAQSKIDTCTDTHKRLITNTIKTKELETNSSPSQINNYKDFDSLNKRKKVAQKKENLNPELHEVLEYFKEQKQESEEAEKFYYYYASTGWIGANKNPITNWRALAEKWMRNNFSAKQMHADYSIHLNTKKDYDEPF